MSVEPPTAIKSPSEILQSVWASCLRGVLSQVAGFPVVVEAAGEPAPEDKSGIWMRFITSKKLQGEMAVLSSDATALPLSQILLSEPFDASVPFDSGHKDAYEELIRQVVGQVTTELKSVARGEVEIKTSGTEAPIWPGAIKTAIQISAEKLPAIRVMLMLSPELIGSISALQETKPAAPKKSQQPIGSQSEKSPASNPNLELLLDVGLNATIRFGQKHMLLRDILELHPGVAIALDRKVEETVELLIGGRTVAKGEVVIVNGNYGLRITEIVSAQQRIEVLAP